MSDKLMSVMGELLDDSSLDNVTVDSDSKVESVAIDGDSVDSDEIVNEDSSGSGEEVVDSNVEDGSGSGETNEEEGDEDGSGEGNELDIDSELTDIVESIKVLAGKDIADTVNDLLGSYVKQLELESEKSVNNKAARVVAKRISEYKVSKAEELAKEFSAEAIAAAEKKVADIESKLTAIEIDSYVKEYNVTAEILKATGKSGEALKSFVELHTKRDSSAQVKRKGSVEDIDSALASMSEKKQLNNSEEEENELFANLLNKGRGNNV